VNSDSSFAKTLKMLIKSQGGFSLAEVMVAAGMLGVLSLGVTQLMQNSAKTEKRLGQQINLINIESEILQALNNELACNRTFAAEALTFPSTTTAPPANLALSPGTWTPLPNLKIFGARDPLQPTEANWPVIVEEFDNSNPANIKGVYGNGSNTVSVRDIGYKAYVDKTVDATSTSVQKWGDASTYGGVGELDVITGTTAPVQSYGRLVIRVEFTRGNYNAFASLTEAERKEKSNKITQGSFTFSKYYLVNVRVRNNTRVISCYNDQNQIVENYCEAFGGTFNNNTGRCDNINIHDNPGDASTENFSVTASSEFGGTASILAQGGLQVGGNRTDTPPVNGSAIIEGAVNIGNPGTLPTAHRVTQTGDVRATGGMTIGRPAQHSVAARNPAPGDLHIGNSLNVGNPTTPATGDGDATFNRNVIGLGHLNVGAPTTTGPLLDPGNLNVQNNTTTRGYLHVGSTNALPAGTFRQSGDIYVENDIHAPTGYLHLGPSAPPAALFRENGDAFIEKDLTTQGHLHIGAGSPAPPASRQAGDAYIENDVYMPNGDLVIGGASEDAFGSKVAITPNGGNPALKVMNSTTERFVITSSGQVEIRNSNSSNSGRISIGVGTANYRPIRIFNQPLDNATVPANTVGNEVATKAWVKYMVYGAAFTDAQVANVLNNLATHVNHKPINTIKQMMCVSTQTGGGACTYGGGICTCPDAINNCSDDTVANGTRVCNDIYVSGVLNATGTVTGGRVHSNDWMRAQRIYTQVSGVSVPGAGGINAMNINAVANIVGSQVRGTNNVRSDGQVLGRNSIIARVGGGGNDGVCTASGALSHCNTKFGKFTCEAGGVMIGIAHGHPICARPGSSSGGALSVQDHGNSL